MWFNVTTTNSDSVPAGFHKDAKFAGVEAFTPKSGGDELLRWSWMLPDNRKVAGVTGNGEPRITNNKGKFACMLANKPLSEIKVNSDEFVGKLYTVFVEAGEKGSKVTGFSLQPQP